MVSYSKSFQEVAEHTKNVEGVKQDFYSKFVDKRAKKGSGFNGSFYKGPVPLA